ncbi:hypothetical protein COM13_22565 [Bacillus pseudomycoides]|uniref:hypothetical protein n=1 Tax=Bacillus TaxID=1386 RepID=UPI000535657B|nr:hypothetical protein [Bacillus pseudomycoides]MCX2824505.1 hypothetical protein [Bacillus sp. DHT2]MDR4915760.1 hypothetical protein [Bacillus pseudomycoides]MEB3052695.1 hypothetical protein [Bacillus pseudomycoides]MED4714088.1 hypothetical protein [Bacillus pseudomycoides]OOR52154.1 hypothetical protein BLX05_11730 [Bacillus pseudomycoides]
MIWECYEYLSIGIMLEIDKNTFNILVNLVEKKGTLKTVFGYLKNHLKVLLMSLCAKMIQKLVNSWRNT